MSLHLKLQYCICHFDRSNIYIKNEPCKTLDNSSCNIFAIEAGSPNRYYMIMCELRLNETKKRQFHMYEHKELVKLDAPWYSPSGHWSKMKGATHSSDFQDGTGQHEKVQLHFWGFRGGRAVMMEPVSHEVLIVLGVATIKLCIVKVISQLCF